MDSLKTVTVGLIGCGFAGNFHSNAWRGVNEVKVRFKTVVDADVKRTEALCEKWGWETGTDDFNVILNDPEIDVVDIALAPVLHLEYARKAMKAGKHVICEKPLTGYFGQEGDPELIGQTVPKSKMYDTVIKEMEETRAEIKGSGKMFMYAENYIYSPSIVKARSF